MLLLGLILHSLATYKMWFGHTWWGFLHDCLIAYKMFLTLHTANNQPFLKFLNFTNIKY